VKTQENYEFMVRNCRLSRKQKSEAIDLCQRGLFSVFDIEEVWRSFGKKALGTYLKKCLKQYRLDESLISCESPTLDL
jgi:hypothetical protein